LIGAFKTVSTKCINNDNEMHHLREYIVNNPAQWDLDQ